jgi:hypothetical protein
MPEEEKNEMKKTTIASIFALIFLLIIAAQVSSLYGQDSYIFLLKWGSYGSENGKFLDPWGIAVDSFGNVYVADSDSVGHRIQKFDAEGNFIKTWGSYGTGDGYFNNPRGIAVDLNNNIYVADEFNNRIQKFDSDGALLAIFTGGFYRPLGVAVDSSGNVYVADTRNHFIKKFKSTGTLIKTWGGQTLTYENGKFNYPTDIAVDLAGNVYVADRANNRIQKFNSDGGFLGKWGAYGSGDGYFNNPWGLTVDVDGNVYVADELNHRIQKFNSTGGLITKWGSLGSDDGEFFQPSDVAVDSSGNVYVVDARNYRIQKFEPENHTPEAYDQSVTTDEDTELSIVLEATDIDDDELTYSIVDQPLYGILTGTPPDVTYAPNLNSNGSDSFTFKANDGKADSKVATINITVNPINDPPDAQNISAATDEDTPTPITLAATDAEEDDLTYFVLLNPQKGSLSGSAPNLTYTPDLNFNGADSFTFKVNDGTADSDIATVSITVNPVNDSPEATDISVTTDEDTLVSITLLATDVDGDALTYAALANPTNGSLSGTAPDLTYTPNVNFSGSDSFTYKANDGQADSDAATVSITINPVVKAYTITATAETGGSITPSGAVSVNHGADQAFTITANSGYKISDVVVDGVSVGAVGTYTFNNVNADHTIHATFTKTKIFTITPIAGQGGKIFPSEPVHVHYGRFCIFFIKPDRGYHLDDVKVDGVSVGRVIFHIFKHVDADHTIEAVFAKNEVLNAVVDIDPNTLKLKRKSGHDPITAYIELPKGYNVEHIIVATVKMNVNGTMISAQFFPTWVGDHDRDRVPDRMVKFSRREVIEALGSTTGNITLTVSGQLWGGLTFSGQATITVVEK